MNIKLTDMISNVLFIGGSPCSGKSTVAEYIAKEYNYIYFKTDDYDFKHLQEADPDKHPTMYRFSQMNWDEIWMRPVDIQVSEELDYYRERFGMILHELAQLPDGRQVIVEGAPLLPEMIKRLNVKKGKAVFLIPSKEFQIQHYSNRDYINSILSGCKDPEKAFSNWMERDHLFGKKVKLQAEELGYKVIFIDGKKTTEENIKIVINHFGLK